MTAAADERIALNDGGSLNAAISTPPGSGPFPGVVVLHEAFGLNDDVRRIADRFADAGYVAIAPDLFSAGGPRLLCLSRLMVEAQRGKGAAFDQIEATRSHLAARADVDADRLGIIGFCMGGGFALAVAAKPDADFKATSINYGAVPKQRDALASVCPVVGSFGAKDRIFASQGARLDEHLTALGVAHDVKVYDDAGHSFLNQADSWVMRLPSPMAAGHNATAAEDAWARIFAFFAEHV